RSFTLAAITSSSRTYRFFFSFIGIRRGTVGGSLILVKRFCLKRCRRFGWVAWRFGSIKRPKLRLRFEIYGKGWLESTDWGVSIGKRLSRKYLSSFLRSFAFRPL